MWLEFAREISTSLYSTEYASKAAIGDQGVRHRRKEGMQKPFSENEINSPGGINMEIPIRLIG